MKRKYLLFISKGNEAPSTRYRALTYFNALRADGWHPVHIAVHDNPLSRLRLLKEAGQADVVIILRKTFNALFSRLVRLCSKHLVLDMDDAIFCSSKGTTSSTRWNRFRRMARYCDQIWVGNKYLADVARRYNSAVSILPTSLDPGKYEIRAKKPSKHIDLVWIGSKSTGKYLEEGLPVLEDIARSLPHIRLKIIADFDLETKILTTLPVPWNEKREAYDLSSAHIGIAPMPDNPWTKGKCGLKVLQYMAAGLPVVSSVSGVNAEIIQHGKTGFLADSPEEWRGAVEKLVHDPELRRVMGETGRMWVMKRYSIDATYPKMAMALRDIMKSV